MKIENYSSPKCLFVLLIGVLRNISPFYYACQIKYIGMLYINKDSLVTEAILFSTIMNFICRFGFGWIVNIIGYLGTNFLCHAFGFFGSVMLMILSYTNSSTAFFLFTFFSRGSIALAFNINYTMPYRVFGRQNGLHLMRLFDFQVLIGFVLGSVLNYVLVFEQRFEWIFGVFAVFDVFVSVLVYLFRRTYPEVDL